MRYLGGLLCLALFWLESAGAAGIPIRIVTANLTSGEEQSYDAGHGIRILQGLKPDVAMIQEFNYGDNSPRAIDKFVDVTFGREYFYHRENDPTDEIPNGIVSKFHILEAGQWKDPYMPNRDFVYAKLDIPGARKLWVVSLHLSHHQSKNRAGETKLLVKYLKRKIPPSDYLVIGGDLNTNGPNERSLDALDEVVSTRRIPVDSNDEASTNGVRSKPFDWIFPSESLERYQVPVSFQLDGEEGEVGYNVYPDGLVFDSRSFPLLDRVRPVRPGDSDSPNMQHMAVVKDFVIPDGSRRSSRPCCDGFSALAARH